MIVPRFWAEARLQHVDSGLSGKRRQITLRRFGWSDESQEAAQQHAETRVSEAMTQALAGRNLPKRERKVPYNGSEGVPIREEIVEKRGETVMTRNTYGARCLNTPNVLFVDVDFSEFRLRRYSCALAILLFGGALGIGALAAMPFERLLWTLGFAFLALLFLHPPMMRMRFLQSKREAQALMKIRRFSLEHPGWSLRVYRTPKGLRVLVTHRTFLPSEQEVAHLFAALKADPLYRKMCEKQQCFRARVSAKPWRAGIQDHMKPHPGTWPVNPERMAGRSAWIERYEEAARKYAACRFLEQCGTGKEHPDVAPVRAWHDQACRATECFPLA